MEDLLLLLVKFCHFIVLTLSTGAVQPENLIIYEQQSIESVSSHLTQEGRHCENQMFGLDCERWGCS